MPNTVSDIRIEIKSFLAFERCIKHAPYSCTYVIYVVFVQFHYDLLYRHSMQWISLDEEFPKLQIKSVSVHFCSI